MNIMFRSYKLFLPKVTNC